MDGVFMTKFLKKVCLLIGFALLIFFASVIVDRQHLNEDLIRLHIVAQSDTVEDQNIKLQVRDALMRDLQSNMVNVQDRQEAEQYLLNNLPHLEAVANSVLSECNAEYTAKVTLRKEAFDIRHYDTFSLPAGVYRSLRVELGTAQGKNWWCVVFPSLCMQASAQQEDVSVFSDRLTDTIEGEQGYELRFFLLDWLGSLEKFFFSAE